MQSKEENFEALKNFLKTDMKIKKDLLELAPSEQDNYDDESKMNYSDKLYTALDDMCEELFICVKDLNLGKSMEEALNEKMKDLKDRLSISNYNGNICNKIYNEEIAELRPEFIEEVKADCVGHILVKNTENIIRKAKTMNELLHVMHMSITNDEYILESMPEIARKQIKNEPVILYGEDTEIGKNIFYNFPTDLEIGNTDIVSMENEILIMCRDRAHALMMDINTLQEKILINYFAPKICNLEMIKALPGVDQSHITQAGATGMFECNRDEFIEKLFDFIRKVPTDHDMILNMPEIKQIREEINEEEKKQPMDQKEEKQSLLKSIKGFLFNDKDMNKEKNKQKENKDIGERE